MSKAATTGVALLVIGLAGCITHGPGEVAYSTRDTEGVGATVSGAGGAVSGSQATSPEADKPRANTPPGVDRDGHGPAAGAIVDPTGAATRTKPY
jgi:hypothetical protein